MAEEDNILRYPQIHGRRDGPPPEGPMLESRVKSLEEKVEKIETRLSSIDLSLAEIKGQLSQMPKGSDIAALRSDIGEIKGRLAQSPTWLQLVGALIATWTAGAGLVFALIKFGLK